MLEFSIDKKFVIISNLWHYHSVNASVIIEKRQKPFRWKYDIDGSLNHIVLHRCNYLCLSPCWFACYMSVKIAFWRFDKILIWYIQKLYILMIFLSFISYVSNHLCINDIVMVLLPHHFHILITRVCTNICASGNGFSQTCFYISIEVKWPSSKMELLIDFSEHNLCKAKLLHYS